MSFDGSAGGPSSQEIVAALAYVPHGLGHELLQALWWPESGQRRREQLRLAVVGLVAPEFTRQMHDLADARTAFGIANGSMGWAGGRLRTCSDVNCGVPSRRWKMHERRRGRTTQWSNLGCWPGR